jgi:hypothetical protein
MINLPCMKRLLPALLLIFFGSGLAGQDLPGTRNGKVSYVTSQNVYVKFQSTENITPGDTLFITRDGTAVAALVVNEISSISCVCVPLISQKLAVGDQVISMRKIQDEGKPAMAAATTSPLVPVKADSGIIQPNQVKPNRQFITGNLSVSSYLNFSDVSANSQRMKYTLSMVAQNIGNSKLSTEIFISFAHKLNEWSEVKSNIFNGLKIYNLNISYAFNQHHTIWLGRKINPRISNAGAIDGLQYELKTGSFTFGVFAGTRPDYRDYSFNMNLLQAGGYVGHDLSNKNGSMQTTVAFIDQLNKGMTDRRFAYLQHTNALLKNLFFFGSVEVDLYQRTMNPVDTAISRDTTYKQDNSPRFSNLYLSLRYRPVRQLSLSFSYSARQNIIYYETYKSIVDRLLEDATVQGFNIQVSYSPVKLLSIGANAGYRSSRHDPRPTKNLYGYVTYSQIPGINVAAILSATILETGYMSGKIYSLGLSRDMARGKLSTGLNYRYVSYKFFSGENQMIQHMGEINFNWRILKKLSLGLYYEGTFDKFSKFHRVYLNLTQRF